MQAGRRQPGRQISPQSEGDSRWDLIWRLVLQAEQLPPEERQAFLQSAEADSFNIRQAVAILEGGESLATAAVSLSLAPDERFIPQTGMKIGRYRIGTLLGTGGSGSVYAALDEELNRPVAIKFVSSRRSGSPNAPPRPLREARAASALNHPNIIMIHEVIEIAGASCETAAIVMELVKGETLREAARRNPSFDEVLRWSTQLANALAVAHHHGLIHGDIKPENVMVRDDGYVKLLDFGLALDAQPLEPGRSRLAGTLRYLSPERCLGRPLEQASDVFAFGVILFELTTGRYPYQAENTLALLQAITADKVPRPATLRPDLPAALDHLILSMLSVRAQERPTARQVGERLTELLQNTRGQRSGVWVVSIVAAVLVIVATASYSWRKPRGSGDFAHMTVRPLASQTGLEDYPSISPDGLWLSCLYRVQTTDRPKLQVHSLQGGRPVEIETGKMVVQGQAAWSPDSKELAFQVREESGHHSVYRVSRNGRKASRIFQCKSLDGACELDWSPDGSKLAVADHWQHTSELYLVDLASGGKKQLVTPVSEDVTRPRISPDGKWVAYLKRVSLTSDDLYVVTVTGGQPRRITRNPGGETEVLLGAEMESDWWRFHQARAASLRCSSFR